MSALTKAEVELQISNETLDIRTRYLNGETLTEAETSTICIMDDEIAGLIANKFLSSIGLSKFTGSFSASSLWVSIGDLSNAEHVKSALRENGYKNLRTFHGFNRNPEEREWVVLAEKRQHFNGGNGVSEEFCKAFESRGVSPLYVYAYFGDIVIDLDSRKDAEFILKHLADAQVKDAFDGEFQIIKDIHQSVDVYQVRNVKDGRKVTPA